MHMLDCLWGTASVRNRTKAIFTPKLRQTVRKRTTIVLDVRRASGDPVWACPARTWLERVCARFWADLASHTLPKVRSGKSHNHQGFVGAVAKDVGIDFGAFSGGVRVSAQAARSIG